MEDEFIPVKSSQDMIEMFMEHTFSLPTASLQSIKLIFINDKEQLTDEEDIHNTSYMNQ